MQRTRIIRMLGKTALLGVFIGSAHAAQLPQGTLLTIDPGVNGTSSYACTSGSCFSVAVSGTTYTAYYTMQPGTDGGIVIGKNQVVGASPATGELAGYTRLDTTEAPGSMYTTPFIYIAGSSDASANKFDDTSCNSSSACAGKTVLGTWNKSGGFGNGSELGIASSQCASPNYASLYCPGVTLWSITSAGAPGIDGDRYVLEYSRTFPDYLDGRYDHTFRYHLEGAIVLPKIVGVDAAVSLGATPNVAKQNTTLTYTATVTNNGTQTATGVILSDTLPASVNFVSASSTQGSCNGSAVVSCALGDIASGATVTVQIAVTPSVAGSLSNSVSVSALDNDVNMANNSATAVVTVESATASADVGVSITASPNPVKRNSNLTYTVRVHNNGPDMAYGVILTDKIPSGMSFVSASTNIGTCTGTSTVTCSVGNLYSGTGGSISIVVKPRYTGTYTNTASATSTTNEKNTSNNSASVAVTVR